MFYSLSQLSDLLPPLDNLEPTMYSTNKLSSRTEMEEAHGDIPERTSKVALTDDRKPVAAAILRYNKKKAEDRNMKTDEAPVYTRSRDDNLFVGEKVAVKQMLTEELTTIIEEALHDVLPEICHSP